MYIFLQIMEYKKYRFKKVIYFYVPKVKVKELWFPNLFFSNGSWI